MSDIRTLPGEVTIYTVGELRELCQRWLSEAPRDDDASCGSWMVGAQSVDQADAAGVQLLLALDRSLAAVECQLCLQNPSSTLKTAFDALGLSEWLELRTVEGEPV